MQHTVFHISLLHLDWFDFTVKFQVKEAYMPSALQIVLNDRLLIDEVVLQGDYT